MATAGRATSFRPNLASIRALPGCSTRTTTMLRFFSGRRWCTRVATSSRGDFILKTWRAHLCARLIFWKGKCVRAIRKSLGASLLMLAFLSLLVSCEKSAETNSNRDGKGRSGSASRNPSKPIRLPIEDLTVTPEEDHLIDKAKSS